MFDNGSTSFYVIACLALIFDIICGLLLGIQILLPHRLFLSGEFGVPILCCDLLRVHRIRLDSLSFMDFSVFGYNLFDGYIMH